MAWKRMDWFITLLKRKLGTEIGSKAKWGHDSGCQQSEQKNLQQLHKMSQASSHNKAITKPIDKDKCTWFGRRKLDFVRWAFLCV